MHRENGELHVFLAIVMRHDFFFQVNLGYRAIIVATAIQGRQDLNQWVTSYTLKYGDNGIRFRIYQSGRAGVRFSIFCSQYAGPYSKTSPDSSILVLESSLKKNCSYFFGMVYEGLMYLLGK